MKCCSVLPTVVAFSVLLLAGQAAAWSSVLSNCAVLSSSPLIYLRYTAKTSSIDVGVYASGSIGGYVVISPYEAGASGSWHSSSSKHDMWVGVASGGSYCSGGCVVDAAISGSGSCHGIAIAADSKNNLLNSSLLTGSGGTIKFEFSRLLSTGDSYDAVLTTSSSHKVVWAIRTSAASSSLGMHSDYGSSTITWGTSRWDSGCPSKPCSITKPTGASGWGTCSSSVESGTSCAFTCSSGYTASSGTCSSGSWTTTPACTASATYCTLSSSATSDTGISGWGTCSTSVTSGKSCSYACASGYTAVAGVCSSAAWTTSPSCSANPCTLSSTLGTGISSMGNCSTSVASGKSCSYSCLSGYAASVGKCVAGTWTTTPSCVVSGGCTLSTSIPSGASDLGTCSATTLDGKTCSYTCLSGYTSVVGTCSSGTWSPSPSCTATSCSLSSSLPRGASRMGSCSTSITSGNNCSYVCVNGYTAVTGACTGGEWLSYPTCKVSKCSLTGLPTGATDWNTCAKSLYSGAECDFTCDAGYSSVTGVCVGTTWGPTPSCEENSCSLSVLPSGASGWGTCSTTVAGGSTCKLTCSSGTAVTAICSKGSWTTAPSCSASVKSARTCGSRTCGALYNGSVVSCGTCQSTDYCDGTNCVTIDAITEWQQIKPDDLLTSNWALSGSNNLYLTNFSLPDEERMVAYVGKQDSWFSNITTVSIDVTATEGVVGLGMRLQELSSSSAYIIWRLSLKTAEYADATFCLGDSSGSESCSTAATSVPFSYSSTNNFTVYFEQGSDYINNKAWLNSVELTGDPFTVKTSKLSDLGYAFLTTKGTNVKTFSSLTVRSKTAVHVTLSQCLTATEWSAFVADLLGVSASDVSSRGLGTDANCATRKRSALPLFNSFETLIPDDMATMTPSSVLSNVFAQAVSDGAAALNSLEVVSLVSALPLVTAGVIVGSSATSLGAAAIGGIAAGSAAAAVLLCAGGVGVAKMMKGTSEAEVPQSERKTFRKTMANFFGPRGGVDVMNQPSQTHSSITNRGAPIVVEIPDVAAK